MIGRALAGRPQIARMPAPPTFEPAAVFGMAGLAPAPPPQALGSTACPTCGAPMHAHAPGPAAAQRVGFGTALAGSVATMTLAGLVTQFFSKRVLGW
jgi:hypothetical protein